MGKLRIRKEEVIMVENLIECDICGSMVEFQEMEEFIDKSQGLKIYVCNLCMKEAEKREAYDEQIINLRFKTSE